MIRVLIIEEGKSNKPVAVLSLLTQTTVIDHWAEMLVSNPGKYKIQINMEYIFCEDCSKHFHNVFGDLLLAYEHPKGHVTETETKCTFIATLQGMAYATERRKLGEG